MAKKKKKQSAAKRRQQRVRRATAERRETTDPLLKEAELQTKAIMRLDVYKRIAYSLVALGVVLIGVGFFGGLGTTAGIVGIVLAVIGIPCSVILYIGTKHGRQNVENMIYDYDLQHGTTEEHKRERDLDLKGETPQSLQRLTDHMYDKAHPKSTKRASSRKPKR